MVVATERASKEPWARLAAISPSHHLLAWKGAAAEHARQVSAGPLLVA